MCIFEKAHHFLKDCETKRMTESLGLTVDMDLSNTKSTLRRSGSISSKRPKIEISQEVKFKKQNYKSANRSTTKYESLKQRIKPGLRGY